MCSLVPVERETPHSYSEPGESRCWPCFSRRGRRLPRPSWPVHAWPVHATPSLPRWSRREWRESRLRSGRRERASWRPSSISTIWRSCVAPKCFATSQRTRSSASCLDAAVSTSPAWSRARARARTSRPRSCGTASRGTSASPCGCWPRRSRAPPRSSAGTSRTCRSPAARASTTRRSTGTTRSCASCSTRRSSRPSTSAPAHPSWVLERRSRPDRRAARPAPSLTMRARARHAVTDSASRSVSCISGCARAAGRRPRG